MTKRYNLLLVALVALLTMSSCSKYNKLLESNDYDKQYTEALKYFKAGKTTRTLTLLANIENIYTNTERADTIKYYIAMSCYDKGDYNTSGELFDMFRKNYGRSPFLENAEYFYAMSFYNLAPNSELDQSYAAKAQAAFMEFATRYPNSERAKQADIYVKELIERRYKKDFYVGETYYKINYHTSAIVTLRNILKRNPETPLREDILFLVLKSQYTYAKESIKSKQKDRFYDVVDSYYSLITEFPESKYKKIAVKMFENAQDIIKGTASIGSNSYDIIKTHDKEYKKKIKLEQKILSEMDKGVKRNEEKLVKLAEQLRQVEAKLKELEGEGKTTTPETQNQ